MSKKSDAAKLAQTKLALAEKCDRLIKVTKSRPRKKTLQNQSEKFRREAQQLSRI